MFKIEGSTIHCSRGERGTIAISIVMADLKGYIKYQDDDENVYWYDTKKKKLYDANYEESQISLETLTIVYYEFAVGDKIKMNIYERNGYGKEPLMTKEVIVSETTTNVYIPLMEEDTTFEKPVNKPTTFWYDVSLNDYLTIIGFDDINGAKEFIEYPAKGDEE